MEPWKQTYQNGWFLALVCVHSGRGYKNAQKSVLVTFPMAFSSVPFFHNVCNLHSGYQLFAAKFLIILLKGEEGNQGL